jgi:predicted Zn-dependent protease
MERFQNPMARMANTIVEIRNPWTPEELEEALLQETIARGLDHAILIEGVSGGETRTDHYDFQAFKGTPTKAHLIDVRSGKKKRIRDLQFIGTPLAILQRVLALGGPFEVDNSYCYAESGSVPVATIAPMMLVADLELQRAAKKSYRPPILPRPPL